MSIRVALAGASGKMGRIVDRVLGGMDEVEVVARLGSASPLDEMNGADIVVDVTHPGVSPEIVRHAVTADLPVLVGTSGWSDDRIASLRPSVEEAGGTVFIVPNFSLGSVLGTEFARLAAPFFDSIEILESHRASKVDSPSGTAVRTAELMQRARESRGPVAAPYADQRARGQQVSGIPVHSLRMDGVIASQEVRLGGDGESLRIQHDTLDGRSYGAGIRAAVRALPTLSGIVVGLDQVLGLPWNEPTR